MAVITPAKKQPEIMRKIFVSLIFRRNGRLMATQGDIILNMAWQGAINVRQNAIITMVGMSETVVHSSIDPRHENKTLALD